MGFTLLKGQAQVLEKLNKALVTKRISHAYLFTGIDGIGKGLAANIFARALNCHQPVDNNPCDKCQSCQKCLQDNHPDIIKVYPDGASLKIAQMRSLQGRVYFKCYEGRFKVIIIHDAHLMTTEAANSLLKVLEEPPQETVFILISEDTDKLPSTILSRCQVIPFQPLSPEVISEILRERGITIRFPLSLAGGSVRKALDLLENTDYQQLIFNTCQMIESLKEAGYREVLAWAESLEKKERETIEAVLEYVTGLYRDEIVWHLTAETSLLISGGERSFNQPAPRLALEALNHLGQATLQLKSNCNTRLVLEVLLLKLRNLEKTRKGA